MNIKFTNPNIDGNYIAISEAEYKELRLNNLYVKACEKANLSPWFGDREIFDWFIDDFKEKYGDNFIRWVNYLRRNKNPEMTLENFIDYYIGYKELVEFELSPFAKESFTK